jgi:amidohydrolase
MVVFRSAEELGAGADAMVKGGLFERFGRPGVVRGQHVGPLAAGLIGIHPGLAFSASDSLAITLHGRGGHGSRPETSVDLVLMAAATAMRLQTIVSRETAGTQAAVVTIGCMHAGTKENIIPDDAELRLNVRTFNLNVRERTLAAIERIVRAEAEASGAPKPATVEHTGYFPPLINDESAVARTRRRSSSGSERSGWSTPASLQEARTSACSPSPRRHRTCSGSSAATRHRSPRPCPSRS